MPTPDTTKAEAAAATARHTPGPWRISSAMVGAYQDGSASQMIYAPDNGREYLVAEAYGKGKQNAKANARLIASAPDLLRQRNVLLAVVERCLEFWDAPPSGLGMNIKRMASLDSIKTEARAAIAAVEGRAE